MKALVDKDQIDRDLQQLNLTQQQTARIEGVIMKLTGKTATPEQIRKLYAHHTDYYDKQESAIDLLKELAPGFMDNKAVDKWQKYVLNDLPRFSTFKYLDSSWIHVNDQGGVKKQSDAEGRIKESNTYKVTREAEKLITWTGKWCDLMNAPESKKVGFVGAKGQPHFATKKNDKMVLNESAVCKYMKQG